MKKKIALLLTVIMLFAAMIPLQAFAAEDKGLEKAITAAREKFSIPANYIFTPESYIDNGKKVWNLNWSSKTGEDGRISVTVSEDGAILGYDKYVPVDHSKRRFPKLSRQEAEVKAEEFIKNVNPSVLSQLKLQENNYSSFKEYSYYFNYVRTVKGIPFYQNNVNLSVDTDTGEVRSYYINWSDELAFPGAGKKIDMDAAKKAYVDKLGLKLVYRYTSEGEKLKFYSVYTPKYSDIFAIDAFTGEKIQLNDMYYGAFGRGGEYDTATKEAAMVAGEVQLTPDEINAVQDMSGLISQEKAVETAKGIKPLKLTDEYKLTNANLSKSWPDRQQYIWYLKFTKNSEKGNERYYYASASINAKTGEIISFDRNVPYNEADKAKYSKDDAKKAVEKFLGELAPEKFKQTEYNEDSEIYYPVYKEADNDAKEFSFSYTRKVNGIQIPDNSISAGYDAVNGEITRFNMSWFGANSDFPGVSNVLSTDKAYERLFADIGLELQYKAQYSEVDYLKSSMPRNTNAEVKLIYSLKLGKPQYLDSRTGDILDYDGKKFKENKPVEYTDIDTHANKKEIMVLSEYGVSLQGPEFKPDSSITQLDFMTLLCKTLNYHGANVTSDSSSADIDAMYSFLIREGVLKKSEKAPKSAVSKEDGVKYIIRAMKYDRVAELKGIFKSSFKDIDKASADLIGYIAIAEGMGIAKGSDGNFGPKGLLTRAQAAVMIYNYLMA
ncbi:peptidase YpeB-like protein [Anaerobacterium chartisolvens]|uniref:Peptidase YpeB-like protein n=1 Tax=Anaerobacterium chartisolvens TaxID=1297424 RepID=A0A369ASJ9_9FIRM|nr:YcdB/YcdC domain-containing protein [Anaerobacterium chartisolvens]RCX12340.1 peptidase YpeB-like protein [Anaerobacterium chartisolvens]